MITWFKDNRDAVIRNSFLFPILLVVIMSISHVVSWYDLGNPISWAIYLSVAIEIFALASVSAASIRIGKGSIWFLFGLVTIIQIIGNIFYEFKEIDPNGEEFNYWIKLIEPIFMDWDVLDHRRFLAAIQGGTLPIMSLTALHFYIKFNEIKDSDKSEPKIDQTPKEIEEIDPIVDELNNIEDPEELLDYSKMQLKTSDVNSEVVDKVIEMTEKMVEDAIKEEEDLPRKNKPSEIIESGTGLPVQAMRMDKGNEATQKAATTKDIDTTTGRFESDKKNQNE